MHNSNSDPEYGQVGFGSRPCIFWVGICHPPVPEKAFPQSPTTHPTTMHPRDDGTQGVAVPAPAPGALEPHVRAPAVTTAGAFPGFLRGGLRRDPGGFPGHHGWPAPPAANFFRARSLATIDTLPNWPKIRPFPQPKTAVFSPVDFIFPPMNRQCQCSQNVNVQPMQEPTTHTTDSRAVLDFHCAGGAAH